MCFRHSVWLFQNELQCHPVVKLIKALEEQQYQSYMLVFVLVFFIRNLRIS